MSRFVYAIYSDAGFIKIGIARKPESRLATLQQQQPFGASLIHTVEVGAADAHRIETEAHKLLKDKRHRGEWFVISAEEAIDAIEAAVGSVQLAAAEAAAKSVQRDAIEAAAKTAQREVVKAAVKPVQLPADEQEYRTRIAGYEREKLNVLVCRRLSEEEKLTCLQGLDTLAGLARAYFDLAKRQEALTAEREKLEWLDREMLNAVQWTDPAHSEDAGL